MPTKIYNCVNGDLIEADTDHRRGRVMNGPRPNFRNDGSTVTIKLPDDLVEPLAAYAKDHNQSSEEAVTALVRMGLMGDDQSGADRLSEDDPDNQGGDTDRMKEHESIRETRSASVMTAAEKFQQQSELAGIISGHLMRGDFASARECERVFDAFHRHETATNASTDEEKRQALVASIVRHGNRLTVR